MNGRAQEKVGPSAGEPGQINSRIDPAFAELADQFPPKLAWGAATVPEHEAWHARFRAKALELIGRMPNKVPLDVRWAEKKTFEGFVRHKIYIRSQANYWVPAFYFVPARAEGRRPAIVCFHGHSGVYPYIREGSEAQREKGRKLELDYAPLLAEHGYVTIAPIVRGWDETCGERDLGVPEVRSCTRVTTDANLLGMSAVGVRCWDAMRVVDFLAGRPEVDPERIGVAGLSGGGMLSLFMPILDERIKLAMIGGYFASFRSSIFSMRHCECNVVPGIMAWGEMSDLVTLYAPRPVLLINGTRDPIFPIAAAREGLKKLEAAYRLLGKPENIEADFFDGEHQWSNRKTLAFLRKHFGAVPTPEPPPDKKRAQLPAEPPVPAPPAAGQPGTPPGPAAAPPGPLGAIQFTVEAEENVYSSHYSNSGAGPMWCYSNTCVVRLGEEVFVSGLERLPKHRPLNDCRWMLFQRTAEGWRRQQADERGRTREPCPLACLPPGRLVLSANPTLLGPQAAGGGPARPELLEFDAVNPAAPYRTLLPGWLGQPAFSEHSYRSVAADAAGGEVILFQNTGYSHAEWALLGRAGKWQGGKLSWPAYASTDLAPFGASHARVNYPVVGLRDRAVHFCGVAAYDNWSRVRTVQDLGLSEDPNRKGASGMRGRQLGNRMRRLLYTWTDSVGASPFRDWLEIDNTFEDGGWLFPGDLHLDAAGTVHLLWYRAPMLRTLRDERYKDIQRVYSICYATLRDGKILRRQTLVRGGEGADEAIPTELDQEGRPYVLLSGEKIVGDPLSTPRFHATPDGRLFVVYYVSGKRADGSPLSENRILEIRGDGSASAPATIPLRHPLTQFFTATPRAGCAASYALDLLGHRRGDWGPREGSNFTEWDGTISYARVRLQSR
ncbi:MAG TPA: acetylxylan esterase [Planctomycetota bacterium]|nr:acetylxylan esterase [Planctomycetota bacterium]